MCPYLSNNRTQLCAHHEDDGGLIEAPKAVHGPTHQVHTPRRCSNGQDIINDNTYIRARLSEHFQKHFSANRHMLHTAIRCIPQLPLKQELDEPPTHTEMIEAIANLQCRITAGDDDISSNI